MLTAAHRVFQSILLRMTGRLLRGETHGDIRPFEQLLPGLATVAEGGTVDGGNPPQAGAREAGLLRAAVALARPEDEDGGVDLCDEKVGVSVRALFDQLLCSNSVQLLKPLLLHGSKQLCETIGWCGRLESRPCAWRVGAQCAPIVCMPVPTPACLPHGWQSACRANPDPHRSPLTFQPHPNPHLTLTLTRTMSCQLLLKKRVSRSDMETGGYLREISANLCEALGLNSAWVAEEDSQLFVTAQEADKVRGVLEERAHLRKPVLADDGKTVSVSVDYPKRLAEIWKRERTKLCIFPHGVVEIAFAVDAAGISKKAISCTTVCARHHQQPPLAHFAGERRGSNAGSRTPATSRTATPSRRRCTWPTS